MFATRKKNTVDSVIRFSSSENTGVLIQPQFRRAIFFERGITIDEFRYMDETPASELDGWVNAKRRLFETERARHTPTPPDETPN